MAAIPPASRTVPRLLVGLVAVGLVLLGGVFSPAPARADVSDFTFDSFAADMVLSRADDGHAELAVVETLVARFPDADQNRGIIRSIPDDYDGVPLHTRVLSVTDSAGAPVPFEVETDRREVRVLTGDDSFVRGVQTYVISYTQRDAIRSFADTDADEFYRDVNGTQWEQPFGAVSARLRVDPALTDAVLDGAAACYVGEQGSSRTCDIARTDGDGGVVFDAGARDLGPGENVTIAVGFTRGTFVPGEVVRTPLEQFSVDAAPVLAGSSVGAVGLGLAGVGAALVARRRGRDAAGRGVIVAEYDPPPGVDVLQGAELVGRRGAGIPAALVDTAVAGHLRIIDTGDARSLSLERVSAESADALHGAVLRSLFGEHARPGARVTLGPDRQDIAKALQKLPTAAAADLRGRGWTEKRRVGPSIAAGGIAVGAFIVAVLVLILAAMGTAPAWWQIVAIPATVGLGILSFALLRYRDRITDAGAPARDHLRGLRDYLQLAEADRLRVLQSPEGAERRAIDAGDPRQVLHLYERLLPWAIVWGVEKEWAEALDTRVRESGDDLHWYRGGGGFSSAALLSTVGTLRTASTPVTATTSGAGSFSGGSFGGGFSGGGSGGGGGGGR
ncbi:Predicted membrane protein [Microbacterium sp. ru370.1]|uniref:DUF2207 domain-containing protein n=1 Tax=unclassified Microbacterium TaxID=2609290 RepID=UPI00088BE86F|nr:MULTISPECIES: DUF2207 domain-containing protein [unclassified Microbacterium]SDO46650.1 Predicted membrane protein [Microbacterium sp. ru370.1]SIT81826.1 Predicted membrane protein [Microbacterium sp. RU1D]